MKEINGIRSTAILCSSTILAKYLIIMPEFMIKHSGNAAWIEIIVKTLLTLISFLVVLRLYKPFSSEPYEKVFYYSAGRFGGVLLRYIYAAMFIIYNAGLLRVLVEALGTVMANNAPDEYFALFIIATILVCAYTGINSANNLSLIFFPIILVTLFIVMLILLPHYRLANIMPIMGKSTSSLISSSLTRNFGFMEIILLFFLADRIKDYKKLKKTGLLTILIVFIFSFILLGCYCLCVPYPASEKFFLPLYQMTRMIKAGSFIERLEPFVVFIWTALILCSMSALSYLSARLLSGLKNAQEKAFVPIVTILTFFISMLPDNEITALIFYEFILDYSYILFPLLPILIISVASVRRRNKTI